MRRFRTLPSAQGSVWNIKGRATGAGHSDDFGMAGISAPFAAMASSRACNAATSWGSRSFACSSGPMGTSTSGTAPLSSRSRPVSAWNQPRKGICSSPTSGMRIVTAEMTPPFVGMPISLPRLSRLKAWQKISALEKVFSLHSTTIGPPHAGLTRRSVGYPLSPSRGIVKV